jgi:phenylacetate-CoA ligase
LEEIRTFGEVLSPDLRETCRNILGVPIVDVYSAVELGYIALQCPESENLHIQSEGTLIEVLDEANQPCGPNTVGRVVVTSLHNFAMPLIRYANGDYAETGEACSCGRTLPVLRRIIGRVRSFVTYPSGEKRFANFGSKFINRFTAIGQYQVIQRTLHLLEVKIVARRPLSAEDERGLKETITTALGYPFNIDITYHESIPRSAGGKFEEFMSELS